MAAAEALRIRPGKEVIPLACGVGYDRPSGFPRPRSTLTMTSKINRRTFAKSAAAAGTLAALHAAGVSSVLGSNERVRLGFIGVGNRGDQLLDAFLVHKDC